MSQESDLRKLADEARTAHQREQEFFTARLKTSMWNQPDHGEIEAWSQSLQAVETAAGYSRTGRPRPTAPATSAPTRCSGAAAAAS